MALCKFFRGKEENLAQQPLTDGYVWVTNNNGVLHMYMDYIDENDELVRKQLEATDEQARQMIANALKGSVAGETILLEDVSPLEHIIKVQLSSENITDFSDVSLMVSDDTDIIPYPYQPTWDNFSVIEQGHIRVSGADEGDNTYITLFSNIIETGGIYCLSGVNDPLITVEFTDVETGMLQQPILVSDDNMYYRVDNNTSIRLELYAQFTTSEGPVDIYPKLTKMDVYTPTSEGFVEITSHSPAMSFSTDTKGVNIEVEYNQDINKVISKNIVAGRGIESVQVSSANAFADNSVALGKNSVVGQKAYHIAAIDFINHFIFLSNEKTSPVVLKDETEYAPHINTNFVSPEYSIGENEDEKPDEISLIVATGINNWMHYHFVAKITSVSNNVIGYDVDLPITELYDNAEEYVNTFFVTSKPMIGAFNLMYGGFAEGENTIASGRDSHAEGYGSIAGGFYGHAEGLETKASYAAHSEGINTTASGIYSHAEGRNGTANGVGAHAEGYGAVVSGKYSHGEGNKVTVEGNAAHAEGESTTAIADYSHAEGFSTTASAKASHSEGRGTISSGEYSHAEGYNTNATMLATHSEGYNTSAKATYSHAEGENTIAASRSQHVQGKWNIEDNSGKYAHIIGNGTGENSKANAHTVDWNGNGWFAGNVTIGSNNKPLATEEYVNTNISKSIVGKKLSGGSEIFNDYTNNVASGNYVHTEGYNNKIYAGFSHGEGRENKIETGSSFSHVEGYKNTIGEKVNSAHAEGQENNINHDAHYSHVEGFGNTISARGGHAEGIGTVAASWYQHVQGRYNEIDSNPNGLGKYAHIIGNGEDANNRKDIHTVDWSGNAWFIGSLTNGTDSIAEEKSIAALGDATHAISEYSIATGYGTKAGSKGYYIKSIDTEAKKIYLSETQIKPPVFAATDNTDSSFTTPAYTVGKGFSIICGSHYSMRATIVSVSNNVITYKLNDGREDLGFTDFGNYSDVDEYTFCVPEQPEIGVIEIGIYTTAEGRETIAYGSHSHAEGRQTIAGNGSHAEGRKTRALSYGHAEGYQTYADGTYSHTEGFVTKAIGNYSHVEGRNSTAEGDYSHVEGINGKAIGLGSHVEGYGSQAIGEYSHVEGNSTIAEGKFSHAEGEQTNAKALYSHAEGLLSKALGQVSHAEGQKTEASGERAHAEGYESIASGNQAHAEGQSTVASGDIAHAEGKSTLASGIASHAEGYRTEAVGGYAHTEGEATKALKPSTHAEGLGTVADSVYQHVQGKYNIEDGNGAYAHIVGNGNDDENRSNAHTLDWNGNAWFAGDVTLGKDNVSVVQTFNDIIDDLVTRPTAEWAEDVANDLSKKDEKISELDGYIDDCIENLDTHDRLIDDNAITIKENEQTSHNIFANALKGSATGEAIALKDTSPVEHIMDVKVRKKNLIPFPYSSYPEGSVTKELNGVTFSIDDKGVITFNGTATANIAIYLWNAQTLPEDMKPGKTITFSKNCSDATKVDSITFSCNYRDASGKNNMVTQFPSESSTRTIGADWVGLTIYLYIYSGATFNNLTIKPQIELGDKATGWTPYLAEDISTVKLNTLGKNLVDVTTVQLERSLYGGGVGGAIEVVNYNRLPSASFCAVIAYIPVAPNTTYSFSLNNSIYWLNRIAEMNSNDICVAHYAFYASVANDYSKYTFTTKADTKYLMIQLKNKNEVVPTMEDLLAINLQIEQGSATEYELYKEPVEYVVNEDGTVTDVVSMYPNMTLTTDTIGAVIDVEYNRDINKAFAELVNAIVALGGNV